MESKKHKMLKKKKSFPKRKVHTPKTFSTLKMNHVIFGDSAAGSLKDCMMRHDAFSDNIFLMRDDLSYGPIKGIDKEKPDSIVTATEDLHGNTIRTIELERILLDNFGEEITKEELVSYWDDADCIKELRRLVGRETIVVWVGPNINEELMYLRLLKNLGKNFKNIKLIRYNDFKIHTKNGKAYVPQCTGEISPGKMELLISKARTVSKNEVIKYVKAWNSLCKKNAQLRVRISNYKFLNKKYDYYDQLIIDECKNEFLYAARIIGSLMGKEIISEEFLLWRIKELVKDKKLQSSGVLGSMRDFKVKK